MANSAYAQFLATFVPEMWDAEILQAWTENFVMKKFTNTQYQGTINGQGDTVHINTITAFDALDYNNDDIAATPKAVVYSTLAGTDSTLVINQQKYWAKNLQYIELKQEPQNLRAEVIRLGNAALMREMEKLCLGTTILGSGANTANTLTTATVQTGAIQQVLDGTTVPSDWAADTATAAKHRVKPTVANGYIYEATAVAGDTKTHATTEPTWPTTLGSTVVDDQVTWTCVGKLGVIGNAAAGKVTAANLYSYLAHAAAMLDEQKVWEDGNMVAVINPTIMGLINTSTELVHATDKADSTIANGYKGTLAGFDLMVSHNITGAGTDASPFNLYLGNKKAICFAENFTSGIEAQNLQDNFGVGLRCLNAYGATVPSNNKYAGLRFEVSL